MLLLEDFNFSDIDWDNCIANSSLSNHFIEILRDNFLIQHVTSPTRARGGDTPHILDLVISNDYFVEDIDYGAPLGKSDHASLVIGCIWQSRFSEIITRHNFNKGDYEAFRDYVNIDWLNVFNDCSNNVDGMWNKFKDILSNGTTLFVPNSVNFLIGKRRNGLDPLIKRLKLISNLRKSHGGSSSGIRILLITININLLGLKLDIILDNYIMTL